MREKLVKNVCGVIFLLLLTLAIGCEDDEKMKIKELRESLVLGMDQTEVEAFLTTNKIENSFISREEWSDFEGHSLLKWHSPDAVGKYKGIIRNVGFWWTALATKNISFEVEIDSNGKVSNFVADPIYTGM